MNFFLLPPEIRTFVYLELLACPSHQQPILIFRERSNIKPSAMDGHKPLHTAILRTCRLAYSEAYPILLGHNRFVIFLDSYTLTPDTSHGYRQRLHSRVPSESDRCEITPFFRSRTSSEIVINEQGISFRPSRVGFIDAHILRQMRHIEVYTVASRILTRNACTLSQTGKLYTEILAVLAGPKNDRLVPSQGPGCTAEVGVDPTEHYTIRICTIDEDQIARKTWLCEHRRDLIECKPTELPAQLRSPNEADRSLLRKLNLCYRVLPTVRHMTHEYLEYFPFKYRGCPWIE